MRFLECLFFVRVTSPNTTNRLIRRVQEPSFAARAVQINRCSTLSSTTHLRIEGFEGFLPLRNSLNNVAETRVYQAQMLGVKSLDLSQNPLDDERTVHRDGLLVILARILPHLERST